MLAVKSLINQSPSQIYSAENGAADADCCDRLFLEEFEDLNNWNIAKEADKELSYS